MSAADRAKYNFDRMVAKLGDVYVFRSERRSDGKYDPVTGNETPATTPPPPMNVRMVLTKFQTTVTSPDGITIVRSRAALVPGDAGVVPDEGDTIVAEDREWRITARPAAHHVGDVVICYRCLLGGG